VLSERTARYAGVRGFEFQFDSFPTKRVSLIESKPRRRTERVTRDRTNGGTTLRTIRIRRRRQSYFSTRVPADEIRTACEYTNVSSSVVRRAVSTCFKFDDGLISFFSSPDQKTYTGTVSVNRRTKRLKTNDRVDEHCRFHADARTI